MGSLPGSGRRSSPAQPAIAASARATRNRRCRPIGGLRALPPLRSNAATDYDGLRHTTGGPATLNLGELRHTECAGYFGGRRSGRSERRRPDS